MKTEQNTYGPFASRLMHVARGVCAVVAIALLAIGCADDAAFAPESAAISVTDLSAAGINHGTNNPDVYSVTGTVDSGSTILTINSDMEFEVPANAVVNETSITLTAYVYSDEKGNTTSVVFDCTPSMTFAVPAEFHVDEDLIDGLEESNGDFHLLYLDNGTWVFEDVGEDVGSDIHFEVDHFSKYAVGGD